MITGHLATAATIASALNLLVSLVILCIHHLRLFSNVLRNVAIYRSVIPVMASAVYCAVTVNFAEGHEEHQTSSVEWTWRGELFVIVLSIQSALFMMLETHKIISEQRKTRREPALPVQSTAHLLEQVVLHLATTFVILAVLESTKVSLFSNFLLAGYCVFGSIVCLMVAISAKYIWDNTKKARFVSDKLKQTSSMCWICMAFLVLFYLVCFCIEIVGVSLLENEVDTDTKWTRIRLLLGIVLIVCPNVVAVQRISTLMEESRKRAYLEAGTSNAHDSSVLPPTITSSTDHAKLKKQRNPSPSLLSTASTMRERTPVFNEAVEIPLEPTATNHVETANANSNHQQQQLISMPNLHSTPTPMEQPIQVEPHASDHATITPYFRPNNFNLYPYSVPEQHQPPQTQTYFPIVQPQSSQLLNHGLYPHPEPAVSSTPLFDLSSLPLQNTMPFSEHKTLTQVNTQPSPTQTPSQTIDLQSTDFMDAPSDPDDTHIEINETDPRTNTYSDNTYSLDNPELNDEDTYVPSV